MSNTKSFFDPGSLSPETQRAANLDPAYYNKCGINGKQLTEQTARIRKLPGEVINRGQNGTYIRQGRNRPGDPDSGYGRYMGAGEISLCAGPSSSDVRRYKGTLRTQEVLVTEPNKALDAAYINISQLDNPHKNEKIKTKIPATGVSSIVAKADNVTMLSRGKCIIATRTDKKNSHGKRIVNHPRIELIAANKSQLLEPLTKATTNNENIKNIIERINELQNIVRNFLVAQQEFNLEISRHQHDDVVLQTVGLIAGGNPFAINGGKVQPSIPLIVGGIKCATNTGIAHADSIMNELKTTLDKLSSVESFGYKNSASKTVYTT